MTQSSYPEPFVNPRMASFKDQTSSLLKTPNAPQRPPRSLHS